MRHGDRMAEVLERGDIRFFYRPRVQPADAPVETPGVQSFFAILSTSRGTHRRLRIGRKRLPARSGERLWARIERVGSLQRALGDQIEAEEYVTKTRGERYQPGARAIAEGCYALVRHDDHVHLAYRVEHAEPDVPDEVVVPDAGSHLVLFKRIPRARAVWTTDGGADRLDVEGAEMVLVGADDEPERELGIEVLPVRDM
jgi:hypothetical protein